MRKKIWQMNLVFIPFVILGILVMVLPYFTFGIYPKTTTIYVYLGIMAFLSLLRSKDSWFFKTNKTFDKVVTLLIWTISVPVFIIFGLFSFIFVLLFPFSIYGVMYILSITVIFIFGIRLKIIESLPRGQFIVIWNHCSTVDDIINPTIMGFRKWKVVFAPEIMRIPFVGYFLKYVGIPLERTSINSKEEVKITLKSEISKGYSILIFPEGRRLRVEKKDEYLSPFNKGAFFLSQTSGVPIVPVVVSWTFLFKPRSGQWWFSPRTITIKFINSVISKDGESTTEYQERVRSLMLEKLIEMQNKD